MRRQRIRYLSRCQDATGVFFVSQIQIVLVDDGTVQTEISIERIIGENLMKRGNVESYTLPDEQETVSCWQVLEY